MLNVVENQFGGEVYKAAAGMSREQGNEIANRFIPECEEVLAAPPDGLNFQKLYDVDKLEPIPEWRQMK